MTKPVINPNLYNLQVKGRFTVAQPMDTCSVLCVCHIATIFCNYNVSSNALTPFHLSPMPFFFFSVIEVIATNLFKKDGT
jgi:hypothetical protein